VEAVRVLRSHTQFPGDWLRYRGVSGTKQTRIPRFIVSLLLWKDLSGVGALN
jgi:hypothetical protein